MKKVFVFFMLIAVLWGISATPYAINWGNIQLNEEYEQNLLDFMNIYPSISYCDILNKETKNVELDIAHKLLEYLQSQPSINYDEEVLKLFVMRCLYNYDEVSSKQMEEVFFSICERYGDKAEHHWVYGNYLVSAGKSVDGKTQLETYMEKKEYYINLYFLENYAYSQLMCGMPLTAYYTITNGNMILEDDVPNQQLLTMIKNSINESSVDEDYSYEILWRISQEEGDFRHIYSTILGFSFPVKGHWGLSLHSFTKTSPAMLIASPKDFMLNGSPLGISILVMAFPESVNSDNTANTFLSLPIISKETIEIDGVEFEKYVYENLSSYNDARNGARGYIFIGTVEPGKNSGARVEHEIDLSKISINSDEGSEGSNVAYYSLPPAYKRINESVKYFFLIDSCNAIAEETEQLIDELFEMVRFD